MYKYREKREYKRIEKQYMARFQIRPDKTQGIGFYDWNSFILKNVSAEGAFFFYNKELEIGTLLYLKIYVPKAILVINCVGKVIRIDKPRHTSMFGTAIKFTEIDEHVKEMMNTTIEAVLE